MVLPAALLVVHVVAVIAWSLPFESHSSHWLSRLDGAYLHVLGLDQQWRMFRNPWTTQESLEFQVICRDGSYTWHGDLGEYSRKLEERLLQAGNGEVGNAVARYVARTVARSGRRPLEIRILRALVRHSAARP